MKIYTISGRKITEVLESVVKELSSNYQVNKDFMDNEDKITALENIVDLISFKETIFKI